MTFYFTYVIISMYEGGSNNMALFKPNTEKKYGLIVIGAGGTGSWFSQYVSKLQDKLASVYLIDGDVVEPKNLARQNFMRNDVGKNKASVVARHASRMISQEIPFIYNTIEEFVSSTDDLQKVVDLVVANNAVPVIIGAVDNNASRKIVDDFMKTYKSEIVWIDSGNSERMGQVIVYPKDNKGKPVDGFKSPFELYENFSDIGGEERRPDQISCAEQSESAPQNIGANALAGTLLFMLVNKMVAGEPILFNEYGFDSFALNVGGRN